MKTIDKATFLRYTKMIGPFISWSEVSERSGFTKATISTYVTGKGNDTTNMEVIMYRAWTILSEKQQAIKKLTDYAKNK